MWMARDVTHQGVQNILVTFRLGNLFAVVWHFFGELEGFASTDRSPAFEGETR